MIRTRVGYAGGQKVRPSYYAMGDHTEAIAIDFDPKIINYEELLEKFWNGHNCATSFGGKQYMNAVFYHNSGQKKLAEKWRAVAAKRAGISESKVKTGIFPVTEFTYAEDYHQKYALSRHDRVRDFLTKVYPTPKALADSTVATRLNAWLGSGYAQDRERLHAELASYGLPDNVEEYVRSRVKVR